MPRPRLPHVRRERTRHDRRVWYFRKGDGPRIRLPDAYGSPEFLAAYKAALTGAPTEQPKTAPGASLAWLVDRYKESAKFASLKPSTRRFRDNILKATCRKVGDKPYAKVTRQIIDDSIAARAATPNAANNFRKVMNQLFTWAVKAEHLTVNPCAGAEAITVRSDGFHTWTLDEVARYRRKHALGTMPRLALDLLLFTGFRRSDVILIGRQHVREGVISHRTVKTETWVYIPIFPDLQASIDATATGDLIFLATKHKKPFESAAGFGNWFRERCDEAGLKHCTAHGLRKAGATIAADNGATSQELMAMFGWSRIAMAEVYTKEADKKRLARAAAERIANAQAPHLASGAAGEVEKRNKSR